MEKSNGTNGTYNGKWDYRALNRDLGLGLMDLHRFCVTGANFDKT